MKHVIGCLDLTESGITLNVRPERVKDMPVSGVVTCSELIAAVPNHANSPGHRSRCHPRKDRGPGFRSIAHANGRAPGVAFINGKPDEDIRVIRIAGIDGAVRRGFHREEEVGIARARNIVRGVSQRRQTSGGRNTHGDTAITAADINRAVVLIDGNSPRLADESGGRCVSVSQATINRALN